VCLFFFELKVIHQGLYFVRPRGQSLISQGAQQARHGSVRCANQFREQGQPQRQRHRVRQEGGNAQGKSVLLSLLPLLLLPLRIAAQIDYVPPESPPGEELLSGQGHQHIANRGAQLVRQFPSRDAAGRVVNQREEGLVEGTLLGEADGAIEPQALTIETRCMAQGVVAGVMVEAAKVAVLGQGPENGHTRQAQRGAECSHVEHRPMSEGSDDQGFLGSQ
jgi:hypothetical protein